MVAVSLKNSEEVLKNDVEAARRKLMKAHKAEVSRQARNDAMGIGDKINSDGIKNVRAKGAEETIIGLMLIYDNFRSDVVSKKIELSPADFFSDFHRRVFEKIIELEESENYDFSMLAEFFTVDEIGRLEGLMRKRLALTENGSEVFLQCVNTLKSEKTLSEEGKSTIDTIQSLLEKKRGGQNQ